jgi:N-acetylglutamate synthase-like GNAT family acetyltransferase
MPVTKGPQFRRATAADTPAIRSLTREAYAKWVPLIGREPLPMAADYDRAVAAHIIDLCERDGELVGLVEMIPQADHLLIENLAVRPGGQGQGLGDALLRHAESTARARGFAEARLYTTALFQSNIDFYTRRGYEDYRRGSVVPGSVTVFMRKALPGEPQR